MNNMSPQKQSTPRAGQAKDNFYSFGQGIVIGSFSFGLIPLLIGTGIAAANAYVFYKERKLRFMPYITGFLGGSLLMSAMATAQQTALAAKEEAEKKLSLQERGFITQQFSGASCKGAYLEKSAEKMQLVLPPECRALVQ